MAETKKAAPPAVPSQFAAPAVALVEAPKWQPMEAGGERLERVDFVNHVTMGPLGPVGEIEVFSKKEFELELHLTWVLVRLTKAIPGKPTYTMKFKVPLANVKGVRCWSGA